MTYDEYKTIVREIFVARWPRISDEWTEDYNLSVMYQRVRGYPADVARRAAIALSQESRFVPTAKEWDRVCKRVMGADAPKSNIRRVDCPFCKGIGMLCYGRMRAKADPQPVGVLDEIFDTMDLQSPTETEEFATEACGCCCENTPQGQQRCTREFAERVKAAQDGFLRTIAPDGIKQGPAPEIAARETARILTSLTGEQPAIEDDEGDMEIPF